MNNVIKEIYILYFRNILSVILEKQLDILREDALFYGPTKNTFIKKDIKLCQELIKGLVNE